MMRCWICRARFAEYQVRLKPWDTHEPYRVHKSPTVSGSPTEKVHHAEVQKQPSHAQEAWNQAAK